MSSPLRTVFLGSDAIALPLLEWLVGEGASQVQIVAVYTQPDRPVGRGQKVHANAIKTWALARNIPVHQPEKLTAETLQQLTEMHSDLGLVMAYGHILKDAFIAAPRLGMVNLHASILPAHRGASPIQTAVALGDKETGVSLMRIVRELDAGPVADVERVPIGPRDTALDIEGKLATACVPLVARNLPALGAGSLRFVEQDSNRVSFCRKLNKDDGVLDFSKSAQTVAARVNGLFPWPASTIEIAGQPIKLGLAEALPVGVFTPAQVLGSDEESLLVGTGDGQVRLLRLQRPGGKMLPAKEFLRGFPIEPGTMVSSRPMPDISASEPFRRK